MTFFVDISTALNSHLAAMVGLPAVAGEAKNYTPTQGVTYLRPTILPAETVQSGLGDNGIDENTGVYQVDVFVDAGDGSFDGLKLADDIATHFARGTSLTENGTDVRITSASRSTGTVDGGWYIVPVLIRYRAFTQPR